MQHVAGRGACLGTYCVMRGRGEGAHGQSPVKVEGGMPGTAPSPWSSHKGRGEQSMCSIVRYGGESEVVVDAGVTSVFGGLLGVAGV